MNEDRTERLSALLDDEIDAAQIESVVDELLEDPQLRRRWANYHLIRSALRGEPMASSGFAARISAAIDDEPALPPRLAAVPVTPAAPAGGRAWLRPLGGLALAASLATVAVLGGRSFETPALAGSPSTIALNSSDVAPSSSTASVRTLQFAPASATGTRRATGMQWSSTQPAVRQRLNGYLVDYSEYLGSDLRGMLPYARVVGYGGRQP